MWGMNTDLCVLGVGIISFLSCNSKSAVIPRNLLTAKSIKMRSGYPARCHYEISPRINIGITLI